MNACTHLVENLGPCLACALGRAEQAEAELERLREGIREALGFSDLERFHARQLLAGLLEPEPVYDVNKCSHCVQGNHARCHGPCNCTHLESEP